MPNKRAQMELLGLAIIMVIVILGILLALRFFFFNVQVNPAQTARDVQLGANLLDTMLETTMICRQVPLSVMLKDCAENAPLGSFYCDPINDPTPPNLQVIPEGHSCSQVNATIKYLLDKTLGQWGRKYEFTIEDFPSLVTIQAKNPPTGCDSGYQKITRPRPMGQSTITLVLKLCQ